MMEEENGVELDQQDASDSQVSTNQSVLPSSSRLQLTNFKIIMILLLSNINKIGSRRAAMLPRLIQSSFIGCTTLANMRDKNLENLVIGYYLIIASFNIIIIIIFN